jgi:hypothetical protein
MSANALRDSSFLPLCHSDEQRFQALKRTKHSEEKISALKKIFRIHPETSNNPSAFRLRHELLDPFFSPFF